MNNIYFFKIVVILSRDLKVSTVSSFALFIPILLWRYSGKTAYEREDYYYLFSSLLLALFISSIYVFWLLAVWVCPSLLLYHKRSDGYDNITVPFILHALEPSGCVATQRWAWSLICRDPCPYGVEQDKMVNKVTNRRVDVNQLLPSRSLDTNLIPLLAYLWRSAH